MASSKSFPKVLLAALLCAVATQLLLLGGRAFVSQRPSPTEWSCRGSSAVADASSSSCSHVGSVRKDLHWTRSLAWMVPFVGFGAALGVLASYVMAPPGVAHAADLTRPVVSNGGPVDLGDMLAAAITGGCIFALLEEDRRLRRLSLPSSAFRPCSDRSSSETFVKRQHQKTAPASFMIECLSSLSRDPPIKPSLRPRENSHIIRGSGLGPSGKQPDVEDLVSKLEQIVGKENVNRNFFQKGSRLGSGTALAIVSPGSLREAVRVLEVCVGADVAILPQGANTSLTGGSVPRNRDCERPTVVVNARRLNKILPIGPSGHNVLCFSGTGIFDLKELLTAKYSRESHSVLGSTFLNPSVGAGVAYGSGGTQIRKGPAWTERALFCEVDVNGKVEIRNTLGLHDGGDIIDFLDARDALSDDDLDKQCAKASSVPGYAESLREFDSTIARYNADTSGPYCCRSEGKVMILATMHDTYPIPSKEQLLWVSCNDYNTANALKREVALKSADCMAKQCEYMNGDVYRGINEGGRILAKTIEIVGMRNLELLWNIKLKVESLPIPFANVAADKILFWLNGIAPCSLPQAVQKFGESFEHHLLIEFSEYSNGEVGRLQSALDALIATRPAGEVQYHVFDDADKDAAVNWRFVAAPAFRTYCVGKGLQGLSIDYALPKRYAEYPVLPEDQYPIGHRWVYSHFGCNVYHEDLAFAPGVDVAAAQTAIKGAIDSLGGRLPAEHGHGTEYRAPPETRARWKEMDPLNIMNPGVGGTSYNRNYS